MKLIVGLGNPGNEYLETRHNAGFWVLNKIAADLKIDWTKDSKSKAEIAKVIIDDDQIILAKPQTFMNLSGRSAQTLASYYKIPPKNILIIQDDLDLEPGTFAFASGGNPAGHHGLESIIENFPDEKLSRLRIGIGRPANKKYEIKNWVLKKPSIQQNKLIQNILPKAASAVIEWAAHDIDWAMNAWNAYKKVTKKTA
ncbi:MAG: aminoacyl-tRNA hydrolase [Patescibacteria group bacterium]